MPNLNLLACIDIVTTDWGPFAYDVYWVFRGVDGQVQVVASPEVGDPVFAALGTLESVDYGAVLAAMGSTDWACFRVYPGGKAPDEAERAQLYAWVRATRVPPWWPAFTERVRRWLGGGRA